MKSLWQEKKNDFWSFYCPHCEAPRRVRTQPKPLARHYFQIGLTAVIFMLICWPLFHAKGIVAFVPFWLLFETIYRTRHRAALACHQCGFDPFLYLTDVSHARREIEDHWRKKFTEKGIPYPEKPQPPVQIGS